MHLGSIRLNVAGLILALAVLTALHSPAVYAQNQSVTPFEADATYDAYNKNFLVQSNGYTYYNLKLNSVGTSKARLWVAALDIAVTEDHYDRTHDAESRQLISALLDTFETDFGDGKNWSYDGWNDDIGWMVNAFLRGYRITGNPEYLTVAKNNYDMAIKRGWDDTLGGGIYENSTKKGKEALSNDPFVWEGVWLYEDTGDIAYLTKAEVIYDWVRTHLFNYTNSDNAIGVPGRIRQGVKADGTVDGGDNFYNSGSFLEAANALYGATGNSEYYSDAIVLITHVIRAGPILHNRSEGQENQWAYWFVKGLSDFCTDNNLWSKYYPWLLGNANAAWSERDTLNLTWNDWTSPTSDEGADSVSTNSGPSAMSMGSAVAIWQLLNVPQQSMIVNRYSGLCMDLIDGNPANDSLIEQCFPSASLDPNQHWMLVPADGHYAIISAATGMAATILTGSTTNGATLVQRPYAINDATLQFDLAPQSNGWYLLRNVNSGLYLNDYHAARTNDAPIVQWSANGLANQNWKLKPFVSFDGEYEIKCVGSDNVVSAAKDGVVRAESAVQTPSKAGDNKLWTFTPTSRGYFTLHNVKNDEVLTVDAGSYSAGASVVQQPNSEVTSNQWMPIQNSDGYWSFYNLNSGMLLDDAGNTTPGKQIDQEAVSGGKNQEFELISVHPVKRS